MRSLRAIKGDTFEALISSSVEMNLDRESKFAWQQSVRKKIDVSPINELMKLLIAYPMQASESIVKHSNDHKHPVMKKKPKVRTF